MPHSTEVHIRILNLYFWRSRRIQEASDLPMQPLRGIFALLCVVDIRLFTTVMKGGEIGKKKDIQ